jgi:hypothetical protein
VPRFQEILLLIGQLNYTWTNTESLLIYLLAGLAQVDKETAIVIFLTLNTTRARIELVERFAKLRKTSPDCRREILAITGEMAIQAKLRNKYSHCIYSFNENGSSGQTQLMRIFDTKEEIRYGKVEDINDQEVVRIKTCINDIATVNAKIWNFVKKYSYPH